MRSSRPAKTIWQAADHSFHIPHRPAPSQHAHLHRRPRRPFHSSSACLRRTKHHNMTREEMKQIALSRLQELPSYTAEEKAQLASRYNAEQMAAIEAAEEAVDKEDLAHQAKFRQDYYAPTEINDFSRIHPTVDFSMDRIQGKDRLENPRNIRNMAELQQRMHVKTPEEIMRSIGEAMLKPFPEDMDTLQDWEKLQQPSDKTLQQTAESLKPVSEAELRAIRRSKSDEYDVLAGTENADQPPSDEEIVQHLKSLPEDELEKLVRGSLAKRDEPLGPEDTLKTTVDLDEDIMEAIDDPGMLNEEAVAAEEAQLDENIVPASLASRIERILEHYSPPSPSLAPEIPKINDPKVSWANEASAEATGMPDDETAEAYARLSKQIGMNIDDIRKIRVKTLVSHRVVNQTRMGKIQSMYYLVVAGNENGMIGLGEGKSAEPEEGVRAARLNAIRSMKPIRRYENRTIYGEVEAKVAATIVKLSARRPGFGLRVNQHVFEIARCAGLQDLACRVPRSRNKMNVAKAVWKALLGQPDPEEVAKGRGRKLVDVRKVYYAGLV